jgi:GH24 family phage-related lysozyme (muramidase)
VTKAQAEQLLRDDLHKKFEKLVNKLTEKTDLTQCQYDALVSFAYNVKSWKKFTSGFDRNPAKWVKSAAKNMLGYNTAKVKKGPDAGKYRVLPELTRRRSREAALFSRRKCPCTGVLPKLGAPFFGRSAAAAAALTAPELFVRERDMNDQPIGDWVPLDGAKVHSLIGYDIGVRVQATSDFQNSQHVRLQITSVPDGHPDQPLVYPTVCGTVRGTGGQIADLGQEVRYEGDGRYGVSVTVAPFGDDKCASGLTTTGSFTVSAGRPASVRLVGHLLLGDPRDPAPFSGVEITWPTGARMHPELVCARDPRRLPDGSLTGSAVQHVKAFGWDKSGPERIEADRAFPSTGRWACVARYFGNQTPLPWSAPTPASIVQRFFYGPKSGTLRLSDPRGPSYALTARTDPDAAGGLLTLELRRVSGGAPPTRVVTRVGSGGRLSFKFRLPSLGADGVTSISSRFTFAGTTLVQARRAFVDFALEARRTLAGRIDIRFVAPCRPLRC